MVQPTERDPTPAAPSEKRRHPLDDELETRPESRFFFPRYRWISPQYARDRNHSFALLGGIVLALVVIFALAAWLWQTLDPAG